ncbi:MAG: hypothetical protein HUU21_07065 [Polyangiaceae bacterium]|nr:hypothetical protein [Polyangiaceae bacterium]
MKEISIGFAKFRAWESDRPNLKFSTERVLTALIHASHRVAVRRIAMLEAYVPLGGMANYGLLGGEFCPDESGVLAVRIHLGKPSGASFAEALAARVDDVRIGLPIEYGNAVLDGIKRGQTGSSALPSGLLTIDHAAHGMVGSSANHFGRVTEGLMMLLVAKELNESLLNTIGEIIRSS